MPKTSVATCFLLLLLTACQSREPRTPPLVVSQQAPHWQTAPSANSGAVQPWLAAFDDTTLRQLITEALAHNLDLQAVAARIDATRAQARIDGAGRLPQLNFGVDYQRSQVRDSGYGSVEYGAFEAMFDVSWELDVWGRIKAGQQASRLEADATGADWHAARLSLAARVAQTWFELTEARLQTAVAEQSIRDRSTLVELVRGRFARGLTRGLDVRLALTDLANAEAQLAAARNRAQTAARRLAVLLGRYPSEQITAAAHLPAPPTQLATGLPSELLARRPDVLAALSRLRAADARLENAEKSLLPRITLTASGGTRSAALTELVDPRAVAWSFASGLTQPLFSGGRLKGAIAQQRALVEAALKQYQSTALNAFREVEQTLAAEEYWRAQEIALREAVAQTEESRKLAVYSYQQGVIEILTLLDSYRSTLIAQSAHLNAQRQLLHNRIEIYLALGGEVSPIVVDKR